MNLSPYRIFLFLSVLAVFLGSCEKQYESIEQLDSRAIEDYVKQGSLNVQQYGATGLYYQLVRQGTGPDLDFSKQCLVTMTVRSINTGFVATDTLKYFNRYSGFFGYLKVRGMPLAETLPRLIASSGMKKGGSIRVLIPSQAAFGRNPVTKVPGYDGEIPGNSCLDVTFNILDDDNLEAYDDLSIRKYIQANNLTGFVKNDKGTYYRIVSQGTGSVVGLDSTINASYTGKLLNGTVFDSASADAPASFTLSTLIPGWQQTVPLIKAGGTIQMLIPSRWGYGLGGTTDLSGNALVPQFSCLYFEMKVISVTKSN